MAPGRCLDGISMMSGGCLGSLWKLFWKRSKGGQKVPENGLEGVKKVFGSSLQDVCRESEGFWNVCGECLEGVLTTFFNKTGIYMISIDFGL